jgi:hypothetical protein
MRALWRRWALIDMHKFNLIENASDSLEHAIQHMQPVRENSPGDWKRIIVDFAHVIELLFKEKLRRIHPLFVFKNIDKSPSEKGFTVGSELALIRLQKIGGIRFTDNEISAITSAREKRNEIEHFEFSISDLEARAIVGQALSFIFSFAEVHLELDWKQEYLSSGKWYILSQYSEFYDDILAKASKRIEEEQLCVIQCTSCHNATFYLEEEVCIVCSHKEPVLECRVCAADYIYTACEYHEEAELCPNCEWDDGYATAHHEKY